MKNIISYIEEENRMNKAFGGDDLYSPDPKELTAPQMEKIFADLAGKLSPECLHCDGEISYEEAMAKKALIDAQWAELEKLYGCKVSEEDTYQWW